MNARDVPAAASKFARGLVRRVAFAGLRDWRSGCLRVELPDGTTRVIGDPTSRDRAAIRVHSDTFFARVMARGELGAGESYVAGEWESDDLVGAIRLFVRNLPALRIESPWTRIGALPTRVRHRLRRNAVGQSARNIEAHYDLGNAFYTRMLDRSMTYSCAYFASPDQSLEDAQRAKYERICARLAIDASDRVLEIGCGWGGFAMHAARTRGCKVTAITVSREQFALAKERVRAAGLDERVEVRLCDYRRVEGQFSKIVSIEMLEAVGYEFFGTFFETCAARLESDGALFVQTIAMPDHRFEAYRTSVDWTQAYIFPGVLIPSLAALTDAMARHTDLSIVHLEDIGLHYAPTLRAWRERFEANLAGVRALGFDASFVRRWRLYLSFSEAAFAERDLYDLQITFVRSANRSVGNVHDRSAERSAVMHDRPFEPAPLLCDRPS